MSMTRNFGVLTSSFMGQPASDLDMFTYGMIALRAAMDGGVDVTGLVSRVGGFLVLNAGLFSNPTVSARFESLFGDGATGAAVTGGLGLRFAMPVGALVTNPDGSIASLTGDLADQDVTGGGAAFHTTFFDAANLATALALAGAMTPVDLRAASDRMRAFLTRDSAVSYSYIGSAVAETAETGFGWNSVDTGAGDDFIRINALGTGTLNGGIGRDLLDGWALDAIHALRVDLTAHTAGAGTSATAFSVTGVEDVVGGNGDDVIRGDGLGNLLDGQGGDDVLRGEDGNDRLVGGEGDDTLQGGGGRDIQDGGAGNDLQVAGTGGGTQRGGDGSDTLDGGSGNDSQYGGRGDDRLNGGAGNDLQEGGNGSDSLEGGDGNDRQDGGGSSDTLNGGNGDDTQAGGAGRDTLIGGAGNDFQNGGVGGDTIDGGIGNDTGFGGEGGDTFIFRTGTTQGDDHLIDFNRDQGDHIVFYDTALDITDVSIDTTSVPGQSTIIYTAEDGTTGTIRVSNATITADDILFVPP